MGFLNGSILQYGGDERGRNDTGVTMVKFSDGWRLEKRSHVWLNQRNSTHVKTTNNDLRTGGRIRRKKTKKRAGGGMKEGRISVRCVFLHFKLSDTVHGK